MVSTPVANAGMGTSGYFRYPFGFREAPFALTALNPTANIEILAAGLLVLDGLARQSFDRLARNQ